MFTLRLAKKIKFFRKGETVKYAAHSLMWTAEFTEKDLHQVPTPLLRKD